MTPTITFEPVATDLPDFIAAEIPAGHTIVARIGQHQGTGPTRHEAATAVLAVWGKAEAGKLIEAAWEANRESIYSRD